MLSQKARRGAAIPAPKKWDVLPLKDLSQKDWISTQQNGQKLMETARKLTKIPDLGSRICWRTLSTFIRGDVKDTAEMTLAHFRKAIPERQRRAVGEPDRRISTQMSTTAHQQASNPWKS
jgi:hypothetical protein